MSIKVLNMRSRVSTIQSHSVCKSLQLRIEAVNEAWAVNVTMPLDRWKTITEVSSFCVFKCLRVVLVFFWTADVAINFHQLSTDNRRLQEWTGNVQLAAHI